MRIGTFLTEDTSGPRTDEGGLAFAINEPLNVAVFVPPVLLFCVGTSIPTNSCSSATGDLIDFGELSPFATSNGTTQMLGATNGFGGYTISVSGTTMTSGNNIVTPSAVPAPSVIGTSQFGINLVDNSVPNVGVNESGIGTGFAATGYDSPNNFKFADGDIVARSNTSSNINKYTTSYIVNVDADQPAGVYSTTLTYTALASF